jgi:hypothetical protein
MLGQCYSYSTWSRESHLEVFFPFAFAYRTNPSINATFGANEAMNGFGIQSQIVVLALGSKIKICYIGPYIISPSFVMIHC